MKLALLISGMYRTHDYVRESWKPIFDLNPDVFYTTWDLNESSYKDASRSISKMSAIEILNKYPESKIDIQEHSVYPFSNNGQRMLFLWSLSVRNMLSANVNYDAVILSRPDIILKFDDSNLEDFLSNLEDNTIYVIDFEVREFYNPPGYYDSILADVFFIGKKSTIEKLISSEIKELIYGKFDFPITDCIHYHVKSLFERLGMKIVVLDNIHYNLLRFSSIID